MKYVKLNSICNFKQWYTIPTKELNDSGYPVYGANGIIGFSDKYNHDEPTIMICCRGATCGSINVSQGRCYINGNAMSMENLSKEFDIDFVVYYLKHYDFSSIITGAAQPQITQNGLEKVMIPSIPLSEQKKIVKDLNSIDEIIKSKKLTLSSLDEIIKSRFIEMFGDLNRNPNNYPIKKLNEISDYWNGLTYKPSDVADNGQGTLVLRSSNIQDGKLCFEDNVFVNCQIKDKHLVRQNDILMCSRNGSARLVGKVALIDGLTEPTSFGAFMMIIRSDYYSFLKTYFETDWFKDQLSTGTSTVNQITGGMLNQVVLPVPSKREVEAFGKFIEQIDKSKFVCA